MLDTRTISERLRRGRLAYTATASTVYEGPTLQDTEAADTIDALVAALEAVKATYEACGAVNIPDIDAALALARGEK